LHANQLRLDLLSQLPFGLSEAFDSGVRTAMMYDNLATFESMIARHVIAPFVVCGRGHGEALGGSFTNKHAPSCFMI